MANNFSRSTGFGSGGTPIDELIAALKQGVSNITNPVANAFSPSINKSTNLSGLSGGPDFTSPSSSMSFQSPSGNYGNFQLPASGYTSKLPSNGITNINPSVLPSNSSALIFGDNSVSSSGLDFGNIVPESTGNTFNAITGGYDSGVGGIDLSGAEDASGGNWFQNLFGEGSGLTGFMDTAGTAFDIGSQIFGAWQGMQQMDMAEDMFDFQKATTNRNLANSAQMLNTNLEDRQRARVAANPNAYTGTSEYMAKNRLDDSAIG